jgi:hypothetical protein
LPARWTRDLDDDRFAVRQAAHRQLQRAGKEAIPALVAAARSESLEVSTRVFRILAALLASEDRPTREASHAALTRLTASDHARAAARARSVLRGYQDRLVARLHAGGASATVENGMVVSVNLDSTPALAPLLPLLHHLPDLVHVSASSRQMDDAALARLRGLPRLRELNLYQSSVGDEGLKHLKSFPRLRRVPMGETKVTDAGLKHLAGLTQLEYLGLRGDRVSDAGLVHLRRLTNLTGLYLGETRVTDAGLRHLVGMTRMEYLRLHDVAVGDAGLVHLEGMANLKRLDLWKTRVTPAGVERLRKALPRLRVVLKEQ